MSRCFHWGTGYEVVHQNTILRVQRLQRTEKRGVRAVQESPSAHSISFFGLALGEAAGSKAQAVAAGRVPWRAPIGYKNTTWTRLWPSASWGAAGYCCVRPTKATEGNMERSISNLSHLKHCSAIRFEPGPIWHQHHDRTNQHRRRRCRYEPVSQAYLPLSRRCLRRNRLAFARSETLVRNGLQDLALLVARLARSSARSRKAAFGATPSMETGEVLPHHADVYAPLHPPNKCLLEEDRKP